MWVLVAEDEPAMGALLQQGLQEENHTVTLTRDGAEAFSAALTSSFDVALLDVMMPSLDGVEVTRRLRAQRCSVPILLLTARDTEADIVKGLDAGADDYLVKPFAFSVLKARIRALARRAETTPKQTLTLDTLTLEPASHRVMRGDREILLTATEFRLLEFLMRRVGRAVSRSSIIEAVWGFDEDVESNTVDVYIKLLREKLESGAEPRLIHTLRGFGYILRD